MYPLIDIYILTFSKTFQIMNNLFELYDPYLLRMVFLLNLIGIVWYGFYGSIAFIIYTYTYRLVLNNRNVAMWITPNGFKKDLKYAYEIVGYGLSTVHGGILAISATGYLCGWLSPGFMDNIFRISIGFLCADIFYLLETGLIINKSFQIMEIMLILHHFIMIFYKHFLLYSNVDIIESARFYLNQMYLAEYAVLPLNYCWYLINTNQCNGLKFKMASILLIITYFVSRVMNFSIMMYNVWQDGLIRYILLGLPIILMNYYWFILLLKKAIKIK